MKACSLDFHAPTPVGGRNLGKLSCPDAVLRFGRSKKDRLSHFASGALAAATIGTWRAFE
jgi:hypothetical protein